ncbi:hypothetical protein PI126_g762 [Phytophthora idaei]|nr:hypothetical protein PI126_g762 [Phytophthora idaei]
MACRDDFWKDTQSWVLLQVYKLGTSEVTSTTLQNLRKTAVTENELEGRRQLIMRFVELGKTTKELKEILDLLYGSTKNDQVGPAMARERRRQIVKLLSRRKKFETC